MNDRILKFRFWHTAWKGKMDYDSDWAITAEGDILCKDSDAFSTGNEAWLPARNSNYVVMQFTGLKDRNGKEIYEGDILLYTSKKNPRKGRKEDEKHCHEVIWSDRKAMYRAQRTVEGNTKPILVDLTLGKITTLTELWEVAGNIYENPELLR